MKVILRSVWAICAGLFVAMLVILLIEITSYQLFPPPMMQIHDPSDREELRALIAKTPLVSFILVLVAWSVGTLAGARVAARLAPGAKLAHSTAIGVLLTLASVANMLNIPHPWWFWIFGLTVFLPSAYLGGCLEESRWP